MLLCMRQMRRSDENHLITDNFAVISFIIFFDTNSFKPTTSSVHANRSLRSNNREEKCMPSSFAWFRFDNDLHWLFLLFFFYLQQWKILYLGRQIECDWVDSDIIIVTMSTIFIYNFFFIFLFFFIFVNYVLINKTFLNDVKAKRFPLKLYNNITIYQYNNFSIFFYKVHFIYLIRQIKKQKKDSSQNMWCRSIRSHDVRMYFNHVFMYTSCLFIVFKRKKKLFDRISFSEAPKRLKWWLEWINKKKSTILILTITLLSQ